jgi:hypothetical protein
MQAPKSMSLEFKIKILAILLFYFPLAKLLFHDGLVALSLLSIITFFTWLFWLKPRMQKIRNYNNRITPEVVNNWLLESFKTRVLKRAVEYLDVETRNFKPEQYIIIPYPVFNQTKKIAAIDLLRIKTEYPPAKNSDSNPVEFYNYSFWNVQVLILSKNFISYYFCSYNFIKDEILNEKSNEYFYQDIALIKNSHEEVNFITKWHETPINEARLLKLIHYSGDTLNLIADIPELQQPSQTIVDIEKIEKTLRLLMRHVREKDEGRKPVEVHFGKPEAVGELAEA